MIGAFGEPIKCYGETTRRGRRQQVRWDFCYSVHINCWLLIHEVVNKLHIAVQYSINKHLYGGRGRGVTVF